MSATIGGEDQITVPPYLDRELLRVALLGSGPYELTETTASGDVNRPWQDPATFEAEPELVPVSGWTWHQPDCAVDGPARRITVTY